MAGVYVSSLILAEMAERRTSCLPWRPGLLMLGFKDWVEMRGEEIDHLVVRCLRVRR